jgi:hypothetical protein
MEALNAGNSGPYAGNEGLNAGNEGLDACKVNLLLSDETTRAFLLLGSYNG